MTKKLQPTRSLRSLLFGGPHLNAVTKLTMEECIRRLREIDATNRLRDHACSPVEFNDLGRMVRWKFHAEVYLKETRTTVQILVNGSLALEGDNQVRIKARIGPDVRAIYGSVRDTITPLALQAIYLFVIFFISNTLIEQMSISAMATSISVVVVLLVGLLMVLAGLWLWPRMPDWPHFPSVDVIDDLLRDLNDLLFNKPPSDSSAV